METAKNALYADVILPLATGSLSFTVPPALKEKIQIGSRVLVPLGVRKYYSGIVQRLHQESPAVKRIRPIERLVDPAPAVTEKQLRLWEWMAGYYMCPIGMVMRAALPARLKLDGFSTEEALSGGYEPPTIAYLSLHPSINSEEKLHTVCESFGRARGQYKALMEIVGFLGESELFASGEDTGSQKRIPRNYSTVSAAVLKALQDKNILVQTYDIRPVTEAEDRIASLPQLTEVQAKALQAIEQAFRAKDTALLHGITGSGKTEIYIHLIAAQLEAGKDVLYLLPEIALTAQLIERLEAYFGDRVVVCHSRLTDNRRAEIYRRLLIQSAQPGNTTNRKGLLILGVRSAVLLPTPCLGLVIVDEEHENTFKQSDGAPRYHARDTAVVLAGMYGAKTLLGSATPSIESYYNATTGKYTLITLNERYGGAVLPQVLVSDTLHAAKRGEKRSHFNKLLLDRIDDVLQEGQQVILFQNRRGFSPYVECGSCGWTSTCPDCNVTLTYHKADGTLRCHYCGYHTPLPAKCPSCKTEDIQPRGFGTEKVEEELQQIFPDAVIDRLDADSTRSAKNYRRIISAFEKGDTHILIGTQMVTKGFDFGNVSLVGVLNADNMLNYPDFRASERAYQLMIQVAGRAGRREKQGTVVIQTSQPQHPVITQVVNGNYEAMALWQLGERQSFLYPPYCRMIGIMLKHRDPQLLHRAAAQFESLARNVFGRRLLGPEAPPVDRIRGEYLLQFLLKIEKTNSVARGKKLLLDLFDRLHAFPEYKNVIIVVDVDPQ